MSTYQLDDVLLESSCTGLTGPPALFVRDREGLGLLLSDNEV